MLTRTPRALLRRVHREEQGQIAWGFLFLVLTVFAFFALAFDAGLFFFDHRTAQNQSEAAALAAVQALPDDDTTDACAAARDYLTLNGVTPPADCSGDWIEFTDVTGEGEYDQVRVAVGRTSSAVFGALSDIASVDISASATARIGRVNVANVMPWAVLAHDPTCDGSGGLDEICQLDTDGDLAPDTDCGTFTECPFGIHDDYLVGFKSRASDAIAPGNSGALRACGNGAQDYENCIKGSNISEFFEEGDVVQVNPEPGGMGGATLDGLEGEEDSRYGLDDSACDVLVHPAPDDGYDPDGRADAEDKYADPTSGAYDGDCADRLVLVPIVDHFPSGNSDTFKVVGVGTFAITGWDRSNPYGDAEGNTDEACDTDGGTEGYHCGMVWGFFMRDTVPPEFLLQRITDSNNPFAPLLIALIE